jgi:uncharacterized cupredoxin-like copper-binding protein
VKRRLAGLAVVGLALAGCGRSDEPEATAAPTAAATAAAGPVAATLSEWSITLDHASAASGDVKFTIKNKGAETHEFVIFKTGLASDKLPTAKDGSVDEEGKGVEVITEVEDIEKQKSADLTATLDPGTYVLICNRVDNGKVHYKLGMRTAFTVR